MKSGSWSSFRAAGALGPSEPDDEPTPEQAKPCADGVERVLMWWTGKGDGRCPVLAVRCQLAWWLVNDEGLTDADNVCGGPPRESPPGLYVWEGRTRVQYYGSPSGEADPVFDGKVRPATLADFAAFGLAAPGGG